MDSRLRGNDIKGAGMTERGAGMTKRIIRAYAIRPYWRKREY